MPCAPNMDYMPAITESANYHILAKTVRRCHDKMEEGNKYFHNWWENNKQAKNGISYEISNFIKNRYTKWKQ